MIAAAIGANIVVKAPGTIPAKVAAPVRVAVANWIARLRSSHDLTRLLKAVRFVILAVVILRKVTSLGRLAQVWIVVGAGVHVSTL